MPAEGSSWAWFSGLTWETKPFPKEWVSGVKRGNDTLEASGTNRRIAQGVSFHVSEKEKFELIAQISLDLNEVKDIDLLLDRILTNARKFFNADAGSIYLTAGEELKFSYTQNNTLQKRLKRGRKLSSTPSRFPSTTSPSPGLWPRISHPSTSLMCMRCLLSCPTSLILTLTRGPGTEPDPCSPCP